MISSQAISFAAAAIALPFLPGTSHAEGALDVDNRAVEPLATSSIGMPVPAAEPFEKTPKVFKSVSLQALEIIGLGKDAGHITTKVSPSFTLVFPVPRDWVVFTGLAAGTSVDSVSASGTLFVGGEKTLWQRDVWRFSLGPDMAFTQSAVMLEEKDWLHISAVGAGLSSSVGYKNISFLFGVGPGVSLNDGSWSVAPRAGIAIGI